MPILRCRDCGYDLTGLRPAGACPECGRAYDKGRLIGVEPDTPQTRVDRGLRRFRTIACFVAAVLSAVLGAAASPFAATPGRPLAIGLVLAGLLLVGGVASYLYEQDEE